MMPNLLIGPYRSGKTGRLLKEMLAFKQEHPLESCIILVPSSRYGRLVKKQLLDLLRTQGREGLFGVHIFNTYQACQHVLDRCGFGQPVLPKEICAAIVGQALAKTQSAGQLQHLSPIVEHRGTSAAILKLIEEFERAALTPEEVCNQLELSAAADSRFIELAKVYEVYWSLLSELGCVDQKQLAFATRKALAHESARDIKFGYLIVDGFDRISPLQANVIAVLASRSQHTSIAFDYPGEHSVTAFPELYTWKQSSFEELRRRFPKPPQEVPLVKTSDPPIQVGFKAMDRFTEMREIARRCKEAIYERRVDPSQLLVIVRDLNRYRSAIKAAFDEAAVPYSVDDNIEVIGLPLMQLLRRLLNLSVREFTRLDVVACLRSPFLNREELGLTNIEVDIIDEKSIDCNVYGGEEQWKVFAKRQLAPELAAKLEKFLQLVTPQARARSQAEHCKWVEDLEAKLVSYQTKAFSRTERAKAERLAISAFRQALRSLLLQENLLKTGPVTYETFVSMLDSMLDSMSLPGEQPRLDAVTICSADQAPNRRYDEIFLGGVVEGEFPKRSNQSGFTSADEMARWVGFGVNIADPRHEPGFERALLHSLLERARKRICFSIPQCDMDGGELLPSFFLQDGTVQPLVDSEVVQPYSLALTRPMSPRDATAAYLWATPGLELPETLENRIEINDYWKSIAVPLFGSYIRVQQNRNTAHNGYFSELVAGGMLQVDAPDTWSASALNNYGQCPFKYWMSNLLKLTPRVEPEPGLTISIKGETYHKVLELYHSKLAKLPGDQREAAAPGILDEAFSEALQFIESRGDFYPGTYWENEKRDLLFRVKRFIEKDKQRLDGDRNSPEPTMFEVSFGLPFKENSHPALKIDTEYGTIQIRGVIDRVDTWSMANEDGEAKLFASVIDYKTGSTPISVHDARQGTNIQLPIYALALERSILPGTAVSNGFYLSINAGKSIGQLDFASEKCADLKDVVSAHVAKAVEGVRTGNFSVAPKGTQACKNCDHQKVCRIVELKQFDPEDED